MRILQRGVLSSRTVSAARVQKLIKEAKIHDETKLYTDKVIPFVPIKSEFRGKQEHREDAVDFIIKIIYMIWKLWEANAYPKGQGHQQDTFKKKFDMFDL